MQQRLTFTRPKGLTDELEQHDATALDDTTTRIDEPKDPAEKHIR